MKILLITYYWHPYNSAGALRWLGLGKFINFDILTCKKPFKGTRDTTMPNLDRKVMRFGYKLPAIIWGLLTIFPVLLRKYDLYIFTSPPESLLIPAWLLQILGRNVLIDMRDSILRDAQPHKWITPIWNKIYHKMKHVVVCAKIVDPKKFIIYHGYDDIQRDKRALDPPVYYSSPVNYETYLLLLRHGFLRDFSTKPKGYGASSFHTIRHLGYNVNQTFNPDEYGQHSWEEEAGKLKNKINEIVKI